MAVNLNQTLLGPKTVLRDNTVFVDEKLIIEGQVFARKIDAGNNPVIIGAGAEVFVDTEIVASDIVVLGRVKAELKAKHEITVSESGYVDGNLTAPKIKIAPTAVVTGLLRH
jgi:cytoskeletal protein CcmA (bactofilin family)